MRNRNRVLAVFLILSFLSSYLPVASQLSAWSFANANNPVNQPPAQVPGTPLPPGVVDYSNSWGLSPSPPSSVPTGPSEPLQPVHNWTIEVSVPTLLVGDRYGGSYVNQTYSFWENGTFTLSEGNATIFGWNGLGGLISGPVTTQLLANSTMAVQRFWLIVGSVTFYDVSVTYSVRYSYGQPSGLKVTIGGHVEWPSGRGNVSLPLLSPLASVIGMSAPLANASGVVTSFDWSDAGSTYVAAVAPDNSSISWSVGKDFSIDPVTITTSQDALALIGLDRENTRRIVYGAGLYWLFYTSSSNGSLYYMSSADGRAWGNSGQWSTNTYNGDYSLWAVGNIVYYVARSQSLSTTYVYDSGTLNTNGSITWSSEGSSGLLSKNTIDTTYISVDSNGVGWVFAQDHMGSTYYGQVFYNYATTPVYTCNPSGAGIMGNLVPITGGMALVWTYPGANALYVSTTTNGGSTWSSVVSVTGYAFNATTFKAASMGNTVYVTASNGSRIYFLSYTLNAATWSGPTDLGQGTQSTITVAGQDLIVGYLYNSTTVAFLKSPNYGAAWDSSLVISRTENASITISSPVSVDSGAFALLAWVSGTSAPYAIRAATFPPTVPNAATSASAWSKPGNSPYEYYFSHEFEYVSPGNGLLGIEQTDFSLAGRGLNLVFERVYSTPYAFTPSSPYMYENYTAVNMGLGWQLNLPWMGQDYLHLLDGQVYEYNWNGSMFENHVGENFLLVNNTSSYDLYAASGLDYHFDSGKKLVSMTDATGNNTISFSYDANGKMTTITDTVGRNVTLCYGGGGQLSTLITPDGNWTYSYSGVDLVSVTDPLGRTTRYQYSTGINSWLPSAVVYPTGGMTTYTWANATVGTEVLTFYVSSQNIEPRNGTISRSTSFNFTVVDGKVTFCNSTISDGTNIVAKTQHDFSNSYSLRKEMDASGNVILQYRTYYDGLNRPIETDVLSPTGGVLANSTTQYDSWGNAVMTDDADGHQTWFSYANTDSYNTFLGAESTFTNGFYDNNSVISPNIHNALVGEAQLQDGPGSAPIETYYDYNAAGEIINGKQLHVPSGTQGYVQSVGESGSGGPTSTLTVDSIFENGTAVSGYYTVLYQNGNAIATGFTPVTFTLNDNQQYVIQVQDYGSYGFDYWADTGSADQTRSISIDSNAALLAVYQPIGGSPPPSGESVISVDTMLSNGTSQPGYYTELLQDGSVISTGFSPVDFTVTSGEDYQVDIASYADYVFSNWGDGNVSTLRNVTPLDQGTVTLTAIYTYKWLVSTFSYDGYGNVLTSTDPLGRTTCYQYSSTYSHAYLTQKSTIVGGTNVTTSYSYNFTTGTQSSQTDPNSYTTSYKYDSLGRLTQVTYPVGNTTHTYNDTGDYVTTSDPDRRVERQTFDGLGRLTSDAFYNGSAVYSNQTYTYNWMDQVASMTTPVNGTYTYTYDPLGAQNETVNPDLTTVLISYDYTSNVKSVIDENGHETQYGYDWTGRLLWARQYYSSYDYYETDYTYDQVGNMLSVTPPSWDTTWYQYDDLNRLTLTFYPNSTAQAQSYDGVGNLIAKTDADGQTTTYSYDSLNRLTGVTYPDNSALAYTYDNDGNRLTMADPVSNTYYAYDTMDRLTNQTQVIGGTSYTTLYSYDNASNIRAITYPDGTTLLYSYDALERISSAGGYANFTYTQFDSISTIQYGNGVLTNYTYDTRSKPTRILIKSGGSTLMDLNYTYDGTGNVLSIDTERYTYDYLNRIASSSGPWGWTNYTYDGEGNMLSYTFDYATTSFSYAPGNMLANMGSTNMTYDLNGNTIQKATSTASWGYSYDYENRLVSVTNGGTTVQTNVYDGDGNRVESTVGGRIMLYINQGVNILYEKNLTSNSVTDHLYANGLQVAQSASSIVSYYQQDALGNTRLTTNQLGSIVFSSDYLPYGVNYGTIGSNEFMYTGKIQDSSTGLYYFGARFYDPSTDRFITQDSNAGSIQDPLSLNRYIYARDNPMTITDPNGQGWKFTTSQAWVITFLFVAAAATVLTAGVGGALVAPLLVGALGSGASNFLKGDSATWQSSLGAGIAGTLTYGLGVEIAAAGLGEGLAGTLSTAVAGFGSTFASNAIGATVCSVASGSSCFDLTSMITDSIVGPATGGTTAVDNIVSTIATSTTQVITNLVNGINTYDKSLQSSEATALIVNQQAYVASTVTAAVTIATVTASAEEAISNAAAYDASVGVVFAGGGGGGKPMMMM